MTAPRTHRIMRFIANVGITKCGKYVNGERFACNAPPTCPKCRGNSPAASIQRT
jgi:hypothetical protein